MSRASLVIRRSWRACRADPLILAGPILSSALVSLSSLLDGGADPRQALILTCLLGFVLPLAGVSLAIHAYAGYMYRVSRNKKRYAMPVLLSSAGSDLPRVGLGVLSLALCLGIGFGFFFLGVLVAAPIGMYAMFNCVTEGDGPIVALRRAWRMLSLQRILTLDLAGLLVLFPVLLLVKLGGVSVLLFLGPWFWLWMTPLLLTCYFEDRVV